MVKTISVGLWACLVTLCAVFLGMDARKDAAPSSPLDLPASAYSFTRTEMMTVPIMVHGDVAGYVMAQLIYAVDKKIEPSVIRSLSYFINDEIYNVIFGAYSSTREVERLKFQDIKQAIIENVNNRFGKAIVKDVFVQQFGYISQKALKSV